MTTKTQLQQKIAELQAQVDAMPDDKPTAVSDVVRGCDGIGIDTQGLRAPIHDRFRFGFRNEAAVHAYDRAFQTILHLHKLRDWRESMMWCVTDYSNGYVSPYFGYGPKCPAYIFGRFATKQSAQAAIDTVGKENIEYAVKVLTGGGYE